MGSPSGKKSGPNTHIKDIYTYSCPALGFLSLPNKQALSHKSTKGQIEICSYNITFRTNGLNIHRVTWKKTSRCGTYCQQL